MNAKHLIKKSIIVGIIFLITIGLMFPSTLASVEIDAADGVWTDSFENDADVILTNCTIEDNAVVLKQSKNKVEYSFADGRSHEAYSYVAYFFFPLSRPDSHIISEYKLREYTGEIYKIKYKDLTPIYYSRPSAGLKRYVVHHFRFKLDAKAEDIGNLIVNWSGKATDDDQITFYHWRFFSENKNLGFWIPLNFTQSQDSYIEFSATITEDNIELSVNKDNFLDICVVANPESTSCTLFTDYVEVISETEEGYMVGYGTATTKDYIEPRNISTNITDFYWDVLTCDDYERGKASIKYHILYDANETNVTDPPILVEDTYLAGNKDGFTDFPVYLNSIPNVKPYDKLKIMANLSTDTHLVSPRIFDWAITWQTSTSRWQDLFNYDFRVEKNKVNVSGGNVSIDPIVGDWPMFGQNPQNTRSTEGKGPEGDDFNWFSIIGDEKDEEILNPVIRDGVLYTSYLTSNNLYYIPDIRVERDEEWQTPNYEKDFGNDKWLVSSPAITVDSIIISTGKTDNEGTSNYVIALDRTGFTEKWKFVYDKDLCYSSSPVVYEDKVFVTSWSGDPDFSPSNANNKVIALDLSHGSQLWEYDLPAGSFSTPAVYKDMVFVGCNEGRGNSLFALDAGSGDSLWNKSVGAIGRASPVIHDDVVFVVSEDKSLGVTERAKVTALFAENGSILWEHKIGRLSIAKGLLDPTRTLADSTPAAFTDDLFVASPDGWLIALDVNDGSEKWSYEVYKKSLLNDILLDCSPAYADGVVYIGSPSGRFYAIDASDGKRKWHFDTFDLDQPFNTPPIVTSPVVSSGLVFFGDNNGKLYSIGEFIEPDQEIEGVITSIPIKIPQGYWWDRFYYTRDNISAYNSITFSILDENNNFIKEIQYSDIIEDITIERTIRLRADLYAKNLSVNPQLRDWRVTFVRDSASPSFNKKTFTPSEGWMNEIPSVFSVEVKDDDSGLNINSAKYVLEYSINNETHTGTFDANCTGEDGTTNIETITANITNLDFYQNITGLTNIEISIYDLAGNKASLSVPLTFDTDKPSSSIIQNVEERYNSEYRYVEITATADDGEGSGILKVKLKYRYSLTPDFSGEWTLFKEKNGTSPTWNFTVKEGGYYELCTIAEDNAHNVEDEKEEGDVSFIYDPNPPTIPEFTAPLWFNTTPIISIKFEDDYLLDTIEYRPNFETIWTTIAQNISEKSYDAEWELPQIYWDQMEEGEEYYLYFWVNDSLGNLNIIKDPNEALTIVKDISLPNINLEIPHLEAEWSWEDTFNISAFADDRNGSGIKSVELFYRYSEDNITWSNWTLYKDKLTSAPFEWEFEAEEGNGYYEFYLRAEDAAGNIAESGVFSTGLNIFPLIYVAAMVVLVIALLIITTALFVLWRKKK
ncbi:MAG: PQQ-binding-like beta-propeller repeat protein [Thermoplasmatales archaeon]|nr:MAG: PQQ-binding-like beta-propeller repeat protein [Thermoplasmatales archaeon]